MTFRSLGEGGGVSISLHSSLEALPHVRCAPILGTLTFSSSIERLYSLNVGTTPLEEGAPHEKPHKPLLLLVVFDLIDEGLATPDRIPWCQELRDRFTARFQLVRKHNDQNNPDLPFRYLAGDGFWQAFEADGTTPIRREIRVCSQTEDRRKERLVLASRRASAGSFAGFKPKALPRAIVFLPVGEMGNMGVRFIR